MIVAIKLIGIFLGVLARSFAPYLRDKEFSQASPCIIDWYASLRREVKRTALIFRIIITLLIFPQFQAAVPKNGFDVYVKLFCTAFGFGFGWHSIVSEAASWAGAFRGG